MVAALAYWSLLAVAVMAFLPGVRLAGVLACLLVHVLYVVGVINGRLPVSVSRTYADCLISCHNQGRFSFAAARFPGNVQVKGVIEVEVK
jgi:uncharacterized membrane protein YqjE